MLADAWRLGAQVEFVNDSWIRMSEVGVVVPGPSPSPPSLTWWWAGATLCHVCCPARLRGLASDKRALDATVGGAVGDDIANIRDGDRRAHDSVGGREHALVDGGDA